MTPRERDYDRLVMAAEPKPFWLDRPDGPGFGPWTRAGMGFGS